MDGQSVVSQMAQRLLDDARTELIRADDKASAALGAVGALVTVVAVGLKGLQPGGDTVKLGWLCGLSICVVAIILLMLAALPRFSRRSRTRMLAYFGDVSRVKYDQDFDYLLARLTERSDEAVVSELKAISKIVLTKYHFLRLGILCAMTGGALLLVSAI
jgi:hypothetical protein